MPTNPVSTNPGSTNADSADFDSASRRHPGSVRVHLIDALDNDRRATVLADLALLRVLPEQQRFVLTPTEVVDRSATDPTHHTFAICVGTDVDTDADASVDTDVDADADTDVDASVGTSVGTDVDASVDAEVDASVDAEVGETIVGMGAVHGDGASPEILPTREPHVLLRGFAIDAAWQERGIGTDAARQALALARQRFPDATLVVLTVHVDNVAGQRVYERVGFARTDRLYAGRAGPEFVMEHRAE